MQPNPHEASRSRRLAGACGAGAAGIGSIAMSGWITGVDLLKSVVPGLVTMKANTALCLMLCGGALAVLASQRASDRARAAAGAGAAAAGLLALVVLSQYVHGRDLGVDTLLFDEPGGTVGTVHPGRMALNTAFATILFSVALQLLPARRAPRVATAAALAILAMSFLALVGYTSGVTSLYGVLTQTQMAVPTAAAFLLLGGGLILARPESGPMRLLSAGDLGGSLARRLLPVVVVVPVILALARLKGQDLGLYGTRTGVWLFVAAVVLLMVPLVWNAAKSLSLAERDRARGARINHVRYEVSRTLARARTAGDALPRVLATACTGLGWELGAVWLRGEDGMLRCTEAWAVDDEVRDEFRSAHDGVSLAPGQGVAGKVTQAGEPLWVDDAAGARGREALLTRLGIRGAFCVPVMVGDRVHGAIELFARTAAEPDPELLEAVASVGTELGLVIERHKFETARRAAEERFRLSFERSVVGMAVTSLENRWLEVNPALCRLLGYSVANLQELTWQDVTHPDDVARDTATVRRALEGREPHFESEKRYVRSDGSIVWGHVTGALIRDAAGEPLHWVIQIVDVTERRRAEAEAATARDSAIEASRLKSEFLANMSHEIRTPMNGVIGMTELLLESPLDDEQREYARLLHTSGETLMAIVNEILDLSKIEAGKVEIDRMEFGLTDAVEDVGELFAERAHSKGVELSVLVESDVPARAIGDEVRIRRILGNLVANAVKFTGAGEVRVRASVADSSADAKMVLFEVADTGIGIEPDRLERLFEPFTQADSSTTRNYGGTGLGLTIARQLTELMGGELGAETRPGEGSRFWFRLPLEPAAPGNTQPPAAAASLEGQRLIVVDDNATNRTIIARHGTAWGMRVDAAANGEEALQLMRAAAAAGDPYAFGALDMHMPGMDGLEVARAVKADPALRHMRLMLQTSSFDGRRAAREAGVSYVLRKPIRRARFLDGLLRREHAQASAAPEGVAATARGATVLVAEDNEINRVLAVHMLTRRGIRVDVAADGRAAVEMAARTRYDAVLMDCHMPVMDGFDATRAIRRAEAGAHRVPVIAVTASSMADDRRRCTAAGMDDFLSKPLNQRQFDATLSRWIGTAPEGEPADERSADEAEAAAAPALDPRTIERLRSELRDDGVVRRLLEMFRDQTRERLDAVDAAAAAGDADALRLVAHTIKGGAASVGAPRVRDAAESVERAAREGRLEEANDFIHELRTEFERSREALEEQEVMA
ncbi:MAG TPA: response regulator [Thermoleophilaceae bacterium]|jgi:PAS domain S-box-containing protein